MKYGSESCRCAAGQDAIAPRLVQLATVLVQLATVRVQRATVLVQRATVLVQRATVLVQRTTVLVQRATVLVQRATVLVQRATVLVQRAVQAALQYMYKADGSEDWESIQDPGIKLLIAQCHALLGTAKLHEAGATRVRAQFWGEGEGQDGMGVAGVAGD